MTEFKSIKNSKKQTKKLCCTFMMVAILLSLSPNSSIAYERNGAKFNNPKNITYFIGSGMDSYNVPTNVNKWSSYCPQVGFTRIAGSTLANIVFNKSTLSNGTYAICTHVGGFGAQRKTIVVYAAFINASASIRNETLVHEVGHTLGLKHTQPENVAKSVMRASGFNGKAYPLSDDIAGIKAIYK
jgi:hypothetical protein